MSEWEEIRSVPFGFRSNSPIFLRYTRCHRLFRYWKCPTTQMGGFLEDYLKSSLKHEWSPWSSASISLSHVSSNSFSIISEMLISSMVFTSLLNCISSLTTCSGHEPNVQMPNLHFRHLKTSNYMYIWSSITPTSFFTFSYPHTSTHLIFSLKIF